MSSLAITSNIFVAALAGWLCVAGQTFAQSAPEAGGQSGAVPPAAETADPLADLYALLADPGNDDWALAEADVQREWSKSGSPAMDLLLRRGREAMATGDYPTAIEHLTALTDHAPDFAEGWNARATAFYFAGNLGLSMHDIRRTLALNPHHYGALAGLGMIFEDLGLTDSALRAYRASLAIHPHQDGVQQSVERLTKATEGIAL